MLRKPSKECSVSVTRPIKPYHCYGRSLYDVIVVMKLISTSAIGAALLLLLHCCQIASNVGQKSDCALTVVENTEGRKEADKEAGVIADEDEGDFEVIQPTDNWQTLKAGQAVPAGSHVRLNLQTGQREVRLGEEQLKYWTHEHREIEDDQSTISADELKRAMKKMKEDLNPDSVTSKYRPLGELKRDMAQLDLLVETDIQIMKRLLDQLKNSNSTTELKLSLLLDLEYMVHQVDNAQSLCSMGGLQLVVEGLNSTDFRLQESSAFVLGSAVSSNPMVQVKAVESGALQTLLTIMATAQPLRVKKKRHFLSHGGLQVLSELFRADGGGVLRTRIVTMLYDMISEKELISQAGLDMDPDAAHKERVHQYSKVSLQGELLEKGWCNLVPQLLESTEHDYREKALRALLAMAPMCLDQYRSDRSLLSSLLTLRDQYQEMVESEMIVGEENSYFAEIVALINALQVKMK
ncbi:nucleotide exchange factor SIL1 isoform X2 [Gasterosteus aculeatus]